MKNFFDTVPPRTATAIADVSRRMYDLRELRKRLLDDAGCVEADDLLAAVREGYLPEHPGYDAWLAVRLIGDREIALHDTLEWRCLVANGGKSLPPPRSGLAALAHAIRPSLPKPFVGGMRLHHDGIAFRGETGIDVLARVLASGDFSIEWRWSGEAWRFDNAPVAHPDVDSAAHVHLPDGTVVASPIAFPENGDAAAIVLAFLEALAKMPTLGLA
ncbi:hypothetical protein DVT68_08080 [Dyella solisilvae]|uniref:Uncharacterized protein n=1 Tax=Dyella solisilvae TaxID=1920168 RepID=A0A370K787_9GAMM|nr:hypothetical protein [Dyella solisilvae]RDI98484.1 hypothetical protein DVT68_08080 [Dyella solisilvae]